MASSATNAQGTPGDSDPPPPRDQNAPAFEPKAQQRGERLLLTESALARAMAMSTTGTFLTGLALALGANELQYGKLAGAIFVGGSMQLILVPILHRLGSRRAFCLAGLGTTRFLRLCLAASPLLVLVGMTPGQVMWVMFFLLLISAITGTASETARQSWMSDLVPSGRLGRFIGWRAFVMRFAAMGAILVYSLYLELWRGAGLDLVTGFQIMIVFGTALGVVGLVCLGRSPEPPMQERLAGVKGYQGITLPLRDPRFRQFIIFQCLWSFSMPIAGLFFHMYMLEYLGFKDQPFGYFLVAATDIISLAIGMVAARGWGRLADRWGTKRMLLRVGFVMALFPLLWIPITPAVRWLVFLIVLIRVFGSGCETGIMALPMQIAPQHQRAVYIGVYRSAACLMTAIAPIVGGAIAVNVGSSFATIGSFTFNGFHVLFVISTIGRLASLWWLRRVE